jgi:hypothetical protein
MRIDLEGIVIIVGNYGSGKTEVSINLAVRQKLLGIDVRVADLDLVNPYFRTREAEAALSDFGIETVVPPREYLKADLTYLSPAVAGMIRAPSRLAILDVGGDDVGATVLASLGDSLRNQSIKMLQVVNPFRPSTETPEGCQKIKKEIETTSRLQVSGWIGNSNLMDETVAADIYNGYTFMKELAASSEIPLHFITAEERLLPDIDLTRFACPVLPIQRQLVPPWRRAESMGEIRGPMNRMMSG